MFVSKILFHILMFSVSVGRTPQLQSKFYVTIRHTCFYCSYFGRHWKVWSAGFKLRSLTTVVFIFIGFIRHKT